VTELNHESKDYSDHEIVVKSSLLCQKVNATLKKLEASELLKSQRDELSFNVKNNEKQLRKLRKMLKPDPAFVIRVDLDEIEDWVDITMSDVVLLKIHQLNDILERKLNRIEKAIKPKPLTREQRLAALKAQRADPLAFMNSGY
jgi:hypothetical protein